MYIDLHVHSNKSDGKFSVKQVIEMALKNGVSTLAFAEHYNISSYKLAKDIARDIGKNRIEIIPAIELGTDLSQLGYSSKRSCHILVYYPYNTGIYKILNGYEEAREKYVNKMVKHLNEVGIRIRKDEIKRYSRNPDSIGRYDIARALIKKGMAKNVDDAYDIYLSEINGEMITRTKPSPIDLLLQISAMGGVPVLAHPSSMRIVHNHGIITKEQEEDFVNLVTTLKKAGLKGMEVATSFTSEASTLFYKDVCKQLGLLTTVGSDFHGRKNDIIKIGSGINGNLCVSDYSIVERLKEEAERSYRNKNKRK